MAKVKRERLGTGAEIETDAIRKSWQKLKLDSFTNDNVKALAKEHGLDLVSKKQILSFRMRMIFAIKLEQKNAA